MVRLRRDDDWIAGYSDTGDGSITWHINDGTYNPPIHYPEEPTMTTRPASKPQPKHGLIRGILFLAFLVAVGVGFRGWLTATVGPQSALATSGTLDVVSAVVMVAVAGAALLLSKRRERTRR